MARFDGKPVIRVKVSDGIHKSEDLITKAVKKDAAEKGLNGTIRIYLNVAQMAAYYTVDEKGSDEYKVDFVRI